jgi:hypothetical protein
VAKPINSPEDELRICFKDLPQVGEACVKHGVKAIQLVGWNDGGQDQGNPLHSPDPRLGTFEELQEAIAKIQAMGVKLILFAKFTWADRAMEWFRNDLHKLSVKDPYGDYYHYMGYQYQTPTQLLDINTKRMIPMCFQSDRYLDICNQEFEKTVRLGAAGILFDECQHHSPTQLCFDESHGHRYGAPTYTNVRLLIHNFREVVEDVRGAGSSQDFLLFLDAPRHLWAAKYDLIDQTPSPFEINVMRQGYEVEALAKEYLEKIILKPDENLILQKTFTDGQFNIRTDILIHKPALDSYDLYEVKSGTSIKKENIYDVTYQFLIVNKHINIDRPFILHLNSEYIRYSNLNLAELFVAEDVTEMVLKLKDEVDKLRDIALETMVKPSQEDTQPCLNPKSCPCPDICNPGLPGFSIFDIPRLSKKKKTELLNQGIINIKDVSISFELNQKQRQIVDVTQSNQELINREAIQKEFQHCKFPHYFWTMKPTYLQSRCMMGINPSSRWSFNTRFTKWNR